MKTCIKILSLLPVLIAGFSLLLAGQVTAQTFTNLYNFTALISNTNSDGASPVGNSVLSGNTLYGITLNGGSAGSGSVFALLLTPPPPPLTILHSGANVIFTLPTNVNGQDVVSNSISDKQQLYRLSQ